MYGKKLYTIPKTTALEVFIKETGAIPHNAKSLFKIPLFSRIVIQA